MSAPAASCPCPWGHLPQHDRAIGIEQGGIVDVGWLIESLIVRVDAMPSGRDGFPVGPDELVRFVAFHEWEDRQAVMDLMEDLSFLLRYYTKGFHAWPRRLATFPWIATVRSRLRVHRRLGTSCYRALAGLRGGLRRAGRRWPSAAELVITRDRTLLENRRHRSDPTDLQRRSWEDAE
jgi:hypothetical protein